MSPDRQALMRYFHNDETAVELAFMLARLSHIWDDLIDKDKPVSDADINAAFWMALVQIPANDFYQQFGATLRPVMASAILNWIGANTLEKRGNLHDIEVAHVTRYALADVLMLMATLIGGHTWGFECAADIRMLCQKNVFRDYLKEQSHEAGS